MQQEFVHSSHEYELYISVKCIIWNFEVLSPLDSSHATGLSLHKEGGSSTC